MGTQRTVSLAHDDGEVPEALCVPYLGRVLGWLRRAPQAVSRRNSRIVALELLTGDEQWLYGHPE